MGKKSGPSPPAAPDPAVTAAAQGAANKETAIEQARLNRINEFTPYGSLVYGSTGNAEVPYSRTITLDPQEFQRLQAERGLDIGLTNLGQTVLNRVGPQIAQPLDLGNIPMRASATPQDRQRVEDALMERLNPYLERDRETLRTQLSNQGIGVGNEAYSRAMGDFGKGVNDARLAVIGQAGAEQSRLFGLQQSARDRAIQEQVLQRSLPLNEIATLLGTAGPVGIPQFGAAPQVGVATPDLLGATYLGYQNQLNAANQAANRSSAGMGSLFGLAGTVAGGFFGGPAGAAIGGAAGNALGSRF